MPALVSVQRAHPDKSCCRDSNKARRPRLKLLFQNIKAFTKGAGTQLLPQADLTMSLPVTALVEGRLADAVFLSRLMTGHGSRDTPGTCSGLGPRWC